MTGKDERNAASVSGLCVISSNCVTVETSLQIVRVCPAPPPEIRLYRLLGDNRVICPPLVPVQNRRAVLSDGFPALQFQINRFRAYSQPVRNIRRAVARLIPRGDLPTVRKSYVFVFSQNFSPHFRNLSGQSRYKKIRLHRSFDLV